MVRVRGVGPMASPAHAGSLMAMTTLDPQYPAELRELAHATAGVRPHHLRADGSELSTSSYGTRVELVSGAAALGDDIAMSGAATGALGGAALAVLGAACCSTPLVFSIFGASGALLAASLRPHLVGLLAGSAALLAFGFWRAYRKSPSCNRSKFGRVARQMLWAAAAVCLFAAAVPAAIGALA